MVSSEHSHSSLSQETLPEVYATLRHWQKGVWKRLPHHPESDAMSIQWLASLTHTLLESYQAGQFLETQHHLENLFLATLVALEQHQLDAGSSVERALSRLYQRKTDLTAHQSEALPWASTLRLYHDHVELWVEATCRGSWQIFTEEERKQALLMAKDLGCLIEDCRYGHEQLSLF
ncbi:MAG: hypothetical protein ACKO37_06665 [Vampirovibrionales bacterium]